MKKNALKLMILFAMIASCSDDDSVADLIDAVDNQDPPVEAVEGTVVLNEVAYLNNQVEIYNNSDASVNLEDYFLCLAPQTYRRIGALETTGNLQLGAGEFLIVNYDMPNEIGGLGLYSNNDDFEATENIVDFVQWGASGNIRESVAVEAGIWPAGEFIPVINDAENSVIYDGEGIGASNWAETTDVTLGAENVLTIPVAVEGSVVLNEVAYLNNQVEIYNNSDASVNLEDYFLCLAPQTYRRIGALETTGNLQLGAGEFLIVNYDMPNEIGGLGLYSNNDDFEATENIVDFVQWGASGNIRESVAVEAGIWPAGEFIPVINDAENSVIYDGEGIGASNWDETTTVTLGAENVLEMPESAVRSIVINEVQYGESDLVELYNNGDETIDLDGYWLCIGPQNYKRIGLLTPESGTTVLAPGEFLVLPFEMTDSEGLGLYSTNSFSSASAIVDFVQWGAAGSAREGIAASAGIWAVGDFIPTVTVETSSIEYDGEGDASVDWSEQAVPSFGSTN